MKTKVIFRKFKEGDVIALFPEVPGTNNLNTFMSYQHIGQHGSADDGIIEITRLATEKEYIKLKRELRLIGYDLEVCCRYSRKMFENKRTELQNMRSQKWVHKKKLKKQ